MSTEGLILNYERNQKLYGSNRNSEVDWLKKVLRKSHVLQKGEYNVDYSLGQNDVWKSTSQQDFSGYRPAETAQWQDKAAAQLATHFQLSNEEVPNDVYQTSVTKVDYLKKQSERPVVIEEDRTINWPDLAPQFMLDRSTGGTEYGTSFMSKVLPAEPPIFPRIDTCKVNLPISNTKSHKYRGTHLQLGDETERYESETRQALKNCEPDSENASGNDAAESHQMAKLMKTLERKSHVFRPGDYNDISQGTATTFSLDYDKKSHIGNENMSTRLSRICIRDENPDESSDGAGESNLKFPALIGYSMTVDGPVTAKDAKDGKRYHTQAHFQFGSSEDKMESVYENEYQCDNVDTARERPVFVTAPKDSEVMHLNPVPDETYGTTSNSADFPSQVLAMSSILEPNKQKIKDRNMDVHLGNHVHLTYDRNKHADDRQKSLSHADYNRPPSGFKHQVALSAPDPLYNYLETDSALPFKMPKEKISEAKYNFINAFRGGDYVLSIRKDQQEGTKSHRRAGDMTHFVLGDEEEDFNTTSRSNYQLFVPSASLRAKKPEETSFNFQHLSMSENTQDMTPDPYAVSKQETLVARQLHSSRKLPVIPVHKASLMQNDYAPIHERKYTDAQKMMFFKNDRLNRKVIAPSHFFHMDTIKGSNLRSTTMTDFIKPVDVTERRLLSAR